MSVKTKNTLVTDKNVKRKIAASLLVVGGTLLVIGCNNDGGGSGLDDDSVRALQGIWERQGYGEVISIKGDIITTYDFTTVSCVLADTDTLDDLNDPVLSEDKSELITSNAPISFTERYVKIDTLPTACGEPIDETPLEIYNHMWATFNEYYAFFNERNVDWLTQLDATRDDIHADMTDEDLFEVLSRMIEPIDDQHVRLASPQLSFDPAQPKGFLTNLRNDFESQVTVSDLETFIAQELALWESNIYNTYLGQNYNSAGGPLNDVFTWGVMKGDVGYLRIDLMILDFQQEIAAQVSQVERILDTALQDLANTQATIVDIRMNPGGTDPIAFAIASRFIDTEQLVVSKFSRSAAGDGQTQSITLKPAQRPTYIKPVVLISSALTTSAAEVFTLAMRSLPHVTHMGERTNGALSDVLEKTLPNGWTFELSNEVYLDADGASFEGSGIPPHSDTAVFDRAARLNGRDSAIDAALMHLGVTP